MRWVYSAGTTKKPKPSPVATKTNKSTASGGFLSTFSSFFNTSGGSTPQRTVTPLPVEPVVEIDPLMVTETQVTLSVFSVDVDVRLNTKMTNELHRSTKKNPPSKLKFELIYVSLFWWLEQLDIRFKYLYKDCQRRIRCKYQGGSGADVCYWKCIPGTACRFRRVSSYDRKSINITKHLFIFLQYRVSSCFYRKLLSTTMLCSPLMHLLQGHATGQTTGIGGHMATRFIPTVERESIDLV